VRLKNKEIVLETHNRMIKNIEEEVWEEFRAEARYEGVTQATLFGWMVYALRVVNSAEAFGAALEETVQKKANEAPLPSQSDDRS
jgi:hypothetical protein